MRDENCIFCKIAAGEIPSTTLYEDEDFRVILDIAPAAKGHCIVLPKEHFDDALTADPEILGKAMAVAAKTGNALMKAYNCQGINIVQNNGAAAGQTVFHLHIHVIPRFDNDGLVLNKAGQNETDENLAIIAKEVAAAF